jgi:CheY-like chemotaxis protein/nitrogen-specific signal transduction histidine kinase
VPSVGSGEVAALAQSFNAMARSLDEARTALETARADAERSNLAKNAFLSRMSHELRTPLNAIIGFGQLLELDELTEDQAESVTHVLRGGRHLLGLINEVLDISRIESGTLGGSIEPIAVGDALADALSLLRSVADAREVRLLTEPHALSAVHVLADHQRLKQVFLNVLSNAIKYNRHGGTVRVSLEHVSDEWVRIRVRDEGLGIPADRMHRLFVPFDRLGAESGETEGTGLGLALSERLVGMMGGKISAESTVGEGSTFTIELRTAEAPEERAGSDPELRAITGGPQLRAATILHIDDNTSSLRLIEHVLAQHPDVRVISAMSATLGIELAREHRPDLVLLDLHLPDLGGIAVLEAIKSDPATCDAPVVVLSADATDGEVERLLAAGVHEYLAKPLDVRRFMRVVRSALAELEVVAS